MLNAGTVNGGVGKRDGWHPLSLGLTSHFFFGQLEIRSTLDMSNKTGGKRPTTANSDLSNHNMVSEVPPERPSVRVSPVPHASCWGGILGNVLGCLLFSAGSKEQVT